MKKVIIFGLSGMAKELCYYLEKDSYGEMVAYTLDRQYIKETNFAGKKVIAYEELEKYFRKDEVIILVAVGYSQMNNTRKMVMDRCKDGGWEIGTFIHSSVMNLARRIGDGNIVFPYAELRLDSSLGNGNIIGTHAIISHDSIINDFNYLAGSNHIGGESEIGNNNFLGINSTIGDRVKVGDYNLMGAGVCLSKKIGNNILVASMVTRERRMSVRGMDMLLMQMRVIGNDEERNG